MQSVNISLKGFTSDGVCRDLYSLMKVLGYLRTMTGDSISLYKHEGIITEWEKLSRDLYKAIWAAEQSRSPNDSEEETVDI